LGPRGLRPKKPSAQRRPATPLSVYAALLGGNTGAASLPFEGSGRPGPPAASDRADPRDHARNRRRQWSL